MTIRALDYLKIDLDGDLNEGLDALEKQPTLAVKGPFVKSKVGPLMPTHTFIRHYRYWYNSELRQEEGPYKDLYTPTCFIPCPGMDGGYWRSTASRIDQIWWFRTPPESRPPLYLSKEVLEERALKNYERKVQRRIDQWSYDVENSFMKFLEWKSRKLYNLDRAMTRIRNKRRTTQEDLKKLSDIQEKYREVSLLEFQNHLVFDHEEFGEYQAKYLDFWTHKYADDRARWLGTPHPTYILPTWHLKLSCGYAVATLNQSLGYFTVSSGKKSGWSSEVKDWADLSAQAPVGLFDKEVHYDEDALLDAVNDMLPRTEVRNNVVVTAVELREFGNLLSEMTTVLTELWKAVESYQKAGKNLMAMFNSSKFLLQYASKGPAHRKALFKTPDWKNVKSSVVYATKGCADAARFLASRQLALRFGDPDSVRALADLWDLFHEQFERIMKPLYTALAAAGNTTSRHRIILDVSHSWESELSCSGLFREDSDHEHGFNFEDDYDAWSLAPTDPILVLRSESKIQKATLVTTDVLVDTFGNQVGVDEAVTRYIMDLVGFNFNPKTVWDLLPYTFVIDWFLDIGSILGRYCSLTNLRFVSTIQGGCVSELYRYTRSVVKRGQTHTSGSEELWRDSEDTYEYVTATNDVDVVCKPLVARVYRRNPVPSSVLEKGRFRFKWDDYFMKGIGASQLLCGTELLMQRIRH